MADNQILNQTLTAKLRAGTFTRFVFSLDSGDALDNNAVVEFRLSRIRGLSPFFSRDSNGANVSRNGNTITVTIPTSASINFHTGLSYFSLVWKDPINGNKPLAAGSIEIEKWSA